MDKAGTGMIENPFITKVGYGVRDFYIADWAGINTETGLGQIYALDQDVYKATGETQRLKDDQGEDVIIFGRQTVITNTNLFHFKNKKHHTQILWRYKPINLPIRHSTLVS